MSILIAIAAIGIILLTLPLLLQLLGVVGVALGYVIGFAILLGIIFGAIYIIGNMTLSDFMSILEIVIAGIELLIFAGLIANSGIIFSKISEKLGYFFGYLAHVIKIPINKIINKRKNNRKIN